jgi:BlaR1 peptidase M56/TonB-dependent Receptor Plug Domain
MLSLFIYILKAILVSGILLGYYWIGLRNTKFHYYNRFYLVGAVLLSLVIPLLDLQWFKFSTPESVSVQQAVQFIYQSEGVVTGEQGLTWHLFLGLSIAIISAVLLILFVLGIMKVYLIKSKGKVTIMERFDFIETALDDAPFSFFRNLFWRKGLPIEDETGQRMLKHELTHIEQLHSYDKLFIGFTTFLFWMNPFFWVIRKELEVVHEFIADEEAVAGDDAAVLAEMLLKTHYHSNSLSVGQSFFYSSIKRRIIMLTSSKKVSYSYARRLLILPVAIGVLVLSSFTIKDSLSDAQNRQMDQSAIRASKLDTIPAKYLDAKTGKIRGSFRVDIDGDMASFKDVKSKRELFKVPLSELSGPANKAIPVEGFPLDMPKKMMFISRDSLAKSEFVIITDGSSMPGTPPMPPLPPLEPGKPGTTRIIINGKEVSTTELDKLDPTIIKTIDIKGDEKVAPKVIMLKIDTAKSNLSTMTIRTSDDKVAEKIESDPNTLTFTTTDKDGKKTYTFVQKTTVKSEWPKDVLFIIDGKEMQSESMKDIDPATIKSINVLKGESAVKLYGEKGKMGVVEITTKK